MPATSSRTDHQVVIIGAGFAGIGMAIRLQQAGIDDFVVVEKDAELGGTWRDNTYPGCACDVPSYLYSFSFELNPHWSRMFAGQDEIWDYLRYCVDKYDIAPKIRYQAEWTGARFDDATGTWDVEVNGEETLTCRALVTGVGALHMPSVPDLPGIESFTGAVFHSALQALQLLDRRDAAYLDVRPDTQASFIDRIQNRLTDTVWQSGCRSWYIDENGRNFTIWPHFTWKYWLETRRLRPTEYDVVARDQLLERNPSRS